LGEAQQGPTLDDGATRADAGFAGSSNGVTI
jgi:hypothetical protein